MNLPNKITLSRIIAIALMIIAMFVLALIPNFEAVNLGNSSVNLVYFIFFIFFILAAGTDCLDGQIARRCNLVTDLGKFLDPIADKMLNDSMMIFLLVPQAYATLQRRDPTMLTLLTICVILMIFRDLVVDGIRFVAAKKNVVIAANIFGKIKTVLQMIAIPMLLLNDWPFSYFDKSWPQALQISNWFFYLATFASLLSGIIYVWQNKNILKEEKMEKLLNKLLEKKLTLGSVESMTGGLFASLFTDVPGASKVFKGSIVSYSCLVKENVVGVNKNTILDNGVVSKEVAIEMAEKGRKLLNVDVCISITGNAGPTCEPGDKPVGCFYIAISTKEGTISEECKIDGNRNSIRNGAVLAMRDMLYLKVI